MTRLPTGTPTRPVFQPAITALGLRLAVKMLTDDGRFQEVPWKAAPLKGKAQIIVAWLGGVLPILTGCLVGYYALLPAMAFVIGLTVWSGWILACTIVVRKITQGKKLLFMYYANDSLYLLCTR